MERNLTRLPLTFEKGLLEAYEDSVLPNGFVSALENWTPLPTGGVRAKNGWRSGGSDGSSVNGSLVGLALQEDWGGVVYVKYVANLGDPDSSVYGVHPDLTADAAIIDTVPITDDPVTMAQGLHTLVMGNPSWDKLYGVQMDGTFVDSGAFAVPKQIRAIAYHNARFWAGGGLQYDDTVRNNRLFFTDPGDGALTAWPAPNYIDIGSGGRITCLREHGDALIIGKDNSLWILSGDPDNAIDLHRVEGGGDAMVGNSIASTPHGIVIAGRNDVYLFDGAALSSISDPISRTYQSHAAAWTDVAFFDDAAYIANDADNAVWVYDFRTQAWSCEIGPASFMKPERLTSFFLGGIEYLVGGAFSKVLSADGVNPTNGLIYRAKVIPPTFERDFWFGEDQPYRLLSPDYWFGPSTFRHLELRIRQRGGNPAQTGLTVATTVRQGNGVTKTYQYEVKARNPGVWRENISLPGAGFGLQFEITQSLPYGQESVMDIEEAVLVFSPEQDPR